MRDGTTQLVDRSWGEEWMMPIYEYHCDGCDARVDVLVRGGERQPVCPECGTALTRKLFSAPYLSRGRYLSRGLADREPGRTCCGQTERCDAPPCSAGGTCGHEIRGIT